MRLYILPPSFEGEEELVLSGKDFRYLTKVLRMGSGSRFAGRDRHGRLWDLQVDSVGKDRCTLRCSFVTEQPAALSDDLPSYRGPFPEIHLYQGLCKGKKMDQIVRQATELGVRRIIPVSSRFGVVDLKGKEEDRRQRLELIVKEALQQSGSPVMTTVSIPIDIGKVADDWHEKGTAIVLHQLEVAGQRPLTRILAEHQGGPVAILVGPEGGFAEDEVEYLLARGFLPVHLKTNILRAETAAIVATSFVQQILVEKV